MKVSLPMFAVVATKLAASIVAPLPISTPLGLMRYTCPFAVSAPCSEETWVPMTRFRIADCEVG